MWGSEDTLLIYWDFLPMYGMCEKECPERKRFRRFFAFFIVVFTPKQNYCATFAPELE